MGNPGGIIKSFLNRQFLVTWPVGMTRFTHTKLPRSYPHSTSYRYGSSGFFVIGQCIFIIPVQLLAGRNQV